MAKIRFKCTCGKALAADEGYAGKVAKCPNCGRPILIPAPEGPPGTTEPAAGAAANEIESLSSAYGAALLARARQKRVTAALRQYDKKARKRNVIIAASLVGVALLALLGLELFRTYGVNPPKDRCPECTWDLLGGLCCADWRTRAAATWEVADAGRGDVAWLVAQMAERGPEPIVKLVAMRSLVKTAKTNAPEYLRRFLDDRDLDVRMSAAFLLAQCEAAAITPAALGTHVRKAISRDVEWLSWYEQAARDPSPSDETKKRLESGTLSRDTATRRTAAWMTAALFGPDRTVQDLLRDPEPRVVVSAIHALAPFLTAAAFDQAEKKDAAGEELQRRYVALSNVARALRHRDLTVRVAAALVLAAAAREAQAGLLEPGLKDRDWFVRLALLKGAESLKPATARELVRRARSASQPHENEWTERVIRRIEDRSREAVNPKERP